MTDPASAVAHRFSNLNSPQQEAVGSVLDGWEGGNHSFILPVVEGPPGTGKTTVGVLGAARHVLEHPKAQVAYVAYTNFAAQNAQESFYKLGFSSSQVLRLTPEYEEKNWERGVVGCRSNLDDLTPENRRVLRDAKVLITTLHSSGRIFNVFRRPLIMVDEFSQVMPPMFFYLLSKVANTSDTAGGFNPSGYALLGDPNQLPVITSQPLLRPNIGNFLLARKRDLDSHELKIQYRMHPGICDAVNALREALHTYPLECAPEVQRRDLRALGFSYDSSRLKSPLDEVISPKYPLVMINTDSLPNQEYAALDQSKCYEEEAKLAAALARGLRTAYTTADGNHLRPVTLSPYNGQVGLIKSQLRDKTLRDDCFTVYKSQGREYPAVIVSFVRKNDQGNIGFLGEPQLRAQTYVACSRAQAKLILLFSFETFKGNLDFGTLLEWCEAKALVVKGSKVWGSMS